MSRRSAVVVALMVSLPWAGGCGGPQFPDTDLYGATLEVRSAKLDLQAPTFRDEVRATLLAAAMAAGRSTEEYRGWNIVVQDGGVTCNGTTWAPGGAHWWNGCVSGSSRTVSVSMDDSVDIHHSQFMHELFHVFLHGDAGHSDGVWRDCQMWLSLWQWANGHGRTVPYRGMWVGAGYQGVELCGEEVSARQL